MGKFILRFFSLNYLFPGPIRSPIQLTHFVFFVIEFEIYIKKTKQTMFRMCSPSLVFIWCFVFFFPFVDLLIVVVVPFLGCVLFLWEDKS